MLNADDIATCVRDLPSLPELVVELQATIQREDVDVHALAARIALDSALSAKILRLANSSFYGMTAQVTTIQQAVSVLGFHSLRTMVAACSIMDSFAPGRAAFDFAAFWRHAIATAAAAKVLAPYCGHQADNAFIAGLLHDIGKLVIATQFPAAYQQVESHRRAHDCASLAAETAAIGIDHATVGGALAAHWRFPAPIQDALSGHHLPHAGGALTLANLVCVADVLAHALDLSGCEEERVPPLALSMWQAIPVQRAGWNAIFGDVERLFGEMCQVLMP